MNDQPMSKTEATALVNSFSREALTSGPHDPLTIVAIGLRTVLSFLFMIPTLILMMPSTLVGGCLVSLSFGVLLLPLSLLWLPLLGLILGSSWLWVKVPLSRPFLLIPGVLLSTVANVYVSLVPDMGESYQKQLKMALCDTWPYSHLVWKISLQHPDAS